MERGGFPTGVLHLTGLLSSSLNISKIISRVENVVTCIIGTAQVCHCVGVVGGVMGD